MKSIANQAIKIIFISTLSFLLCVCCTQTSTPAPQITVDVSQVLTDISHNPIGINLNFLLDNETVAKASRNLNLGSLRYPIGEIADYYLFDRNLPTQPKISIQDSSLWFSNFTNPDGTWKNLFNFDQFVSVCRSLNTEPFVVIGIDSLAYRGNSPHAQLEEVLQAAVDWVEYANLIKGYNIKYWEIGNENDLAHDSVKWTAETYAHTVVKFSQAMKQVDPKIEIGVNGMTGSAWWNKVMPIVKNDVDFLVTHQYSSMGNYQQWKSNNWNYTSNLETAQQAIATYNPELELNVTEVSSFNPGVPQANNIWKMLHNFEMLGNLLCFDKVSYFHFWISRWFTNNPYLIDASLFNNNYQLMPMGYPLKIWSSFLKQQMVFSTKQVGKIRSWASYDPTDASLNIFLLNKDEGERALSIELKNYNAIMNAQTWVLSGETPYTTKPIWNQVDTSPQPKKSSINLKLQPLSITVIAIEQ
jgi:alpha-L-arabinofuranosidase